MGSEHYSVTLIAEPSASICNYARALVKNGRQVNFFEPSDIEQLLAKEQPENHFFVCDVFDRAYIITHRFDKLTKERPRPSVFLIRRDFKKTAEYVYIVIGGIPIKQSANYRKLTDLLNRIEESTEELLRAIYSSQKPETI